MLPAAVPSSNGSMLRRLLRAPARHAARLRAALSSPRGGPRARGAACAWASSDATRRPAAVAPALGEDRARRAPRRRRDWFARPAAPSLAARGLASGARPPLGGTRADDPRVVAAAAAPREEETPDDPDDDDDDDESRAKAREILASIPSICPGCGVGLQCEDKNLPGFFVVPKRLLERRGEDDDDDDDDDVEEAGALYSDDDGASSSSSSPVARLGLDDADLAFLDEIDDEEADASRADGSDSAASSGSISSAALRDAAEMEALGEEDADDDLDADAGLFSSWPPPADDEADVFIEDAAIEDFVMGPGDFDFDDADFFEDGWLDDLDIEISDGDYRDVASGFGGAFALGGVSNENTAADSAAARNDPDEDAALAALESLFGDESLDSDDSRASIEARRDARHKRRAGGAEAVTCARCFSLRTAGRVKNEAAEILMPSFDFARVVGDRLDRVGPNGAVVLLVVDVVDFDGSFPVDAVDVLAPYVADETVDALLVANKVDLLPTQCTRARITSFAQRRARAFGLKRASGVHLVSAHTGMGVNILSEQLEQLLDEGKEVWVVGAQNAGKSSLINRLSKKYGGPGPDEGGPLASHVPGTTLGVVRLQDLLPNGSDVYDTPGLLQPFQVASRLTADEARAVLPRRRLAPRTYRAEIGSSLHVGALARIDVLDGPQRTVYLTVWCSADVPTHYAVRGGEKADALYARHAGGKLRPPFGESRVARMGEWGSRVVVTRGASWSRSERDISIGGLGWIGVACAGEATFRVWTHEGVQVETREALVPDLARDLHRPGFSNETRVGGADKRPSKRGPGKGRKREGRGKRRGGG